MPAYKTPLRDIRFLMNEVFDFNSHYQTLSNGEYADKETVDMILEGAADFCENVLSPLNQSGDEEGCYFENAQEWFSSRNPFIRRKAGDEVDVCKPQQGPYYVNPPILH